MHPGTLIKIINDYNLKRYDKFTPLQAVSLDEKFQRVIRRGIRKVDIPGGSGNPVSLGIQREFVGKFKLNRVLYFVTKWERDQGTNFGIPASALEPVIKPLDSSNRE
jgi:hypothetical protein